MMTDANTDISNKELRSFGMVFTGGILLIFGIFFPWLLENPWPVWPWIVAGVVILPTLVMPALLAPVYKIWMKIGHVLGWVNTRIILGIMFYMVFTPVSLVLFIMRKDPMRRTLDANVDTYRIESIKAPRNRLEFPF